MATKRQLSYKFSVDSSNYDNGDVDDGEVEDYVQKINKRNYEINNPVKVENYLQNNTSRKYDVSANSNELGVASVENCSSNSTNKDDAIIRGSRDIDGAKLENYVQNIISSSKEIATMSLNNRDFVDECLRVHNSHRANHGVPPLTLSTEITAMAQKWVQNIASKNVFQHSQPADRMYKGEQMGENIAMKFDSRLDDYTGTDAVSQWYSEIERFNFETASGPRTGHFTQVVWKESQELGIGRAKTKDGKWLVVANYYPAGNFMGEYAKNVFPPKMPPSVLSSNPPAGKASVRRSGSHSSDSSSSDEDGGSRQSYPVSQNMSGSKPQLQGTSVAKSTRTETTRGTDGKVTTKTIITETKIDGEGNKSTTVREIVKEEDDVPETQSPKTERSSSWKPGKFILDRLDRKSTDGDKKQSTKDFTEDILKTHNKHRKLHGKVGDLKYNKDLALLAQGWADHLATISVLQHSTNTYQGDRLGENVASKWSSAGADYTGSDVVDQWYSEVENYNYNTDHQANAGHFSQVVWKGSRQVGAGKAWSPDGRVYVVCNYHPAGNILTQFKDNVFAPKK